MFSKIVFTVLLFHTTDGSLVIDNYSQTGVYLSEYCPSMKYCPEGTHTMCMYYNPDQPMGTRCHNPQNVTMTPEIATRFLDVTNGIRSRLALGEEKGKRGMKFPRAYGMFKLKWDSELATFAQVFANQCILSHDICRATKRFPNPGQLASNIRYTYPDWRAVRNATYFKNPGFTTTKLMNGATLTLRSWYNDKYSVTEQMIGSYPDWNKNHNSRDGMLYLEMTYAPATHMGCGVAAYSEYQYGTPLLFNSMLFVCNFSSRPRKGSMVYNTTAPTTPEFSQRCGCPPGSFEDEDCLCDYDNSQDGLQKYRDCPEGVCDPTLVILPIFSVEDAPPEKLISIRRNDTRNLRHESMEFMDLFKGSEKRDMDQDFLQNLFANKNRYRNTAPARTHKVNGIPRPSKNRNVNVKNRHFNRPPQPNLSHYQRTPALGTLANHDLYKKQSLFSRQAKFMLPSSSGYTHIIPHNSILRGTNKIIKDVPARKDFAEVQKLVDSYLGKNKHFDPLHKKNKLLGHKDKYDVLLPNHETYFNNVHEQGTETILHSAEDRVIDFSSHVTNQNLTSFIHRKETEDTDNKLMNLLDNLEKEVKNIELRGEEKQIFDAKIRKIYGKVLGNHDESTGSKQKNPSRKLFDSSKETKVNYRRNNQKFVRNKNEILKTRKVENRIQLNDIVDKKPYNKHPDLDYNTKLHSRNRNPMIDEEHDNNVRSTKPLSSLDELASYGKHNNDLKIRNTYKGDFDAGINKKHFVDLPKRIVTKPRSWDINEDPLSTERRKYYQDKLENLERKLQNTQNYKRQHRVENGRQVRRMRPTGDYHIRQSSSKKQIDPFYMPEGARYLHGY